MYPSCPLLLSTSFYDRCLHFLFFPPTIYQSPSTHWKRKPPLSVTNYIQGTWFDSTIWPVTAWSVFGKSVRTNNDVEGWHNCVNTHAQKCNLQFYLLIELMYKKHPRYHFNWRWYLKENYVVDNESRPRWYSGKSYSYGTTTPTTRLQLVIYWRSVAAFILPVCRVFSDIVCIWMNRCVYVLMLW